MQHIGILYIVYMWNYPGWRIARSGVPYPFSGLKCNECDWLVPGTWKGD